MGEDYPFGYTGMRVGPSVERARMVQRRRDYEGLRGYGASPSYADYNLRFASHNGRSLINPNTVFVGTVGYPHGPRCGKRDRQARHPLTHPRPRPILHPGSRRSPRVRSEESGVSSVRIVQARPSADVNPLGAAARP